MKKNKKNMTMFDYMVFGFVIFLVLGSLLVGNYMGALEIVVAIFVFGVIYNGINWVK